MTDAAITTTPVDEAAWSDVARVFGTRGDAAGCWCQWFRLSSSEYKQTSVDDKRERMREQSTRHPAPGVVAFLHGEPVGWCAVAPRSEYPVLARSRVANPDAHAGGVDRADGDPGRWAITCFVVRVGYRKRGVAAALLLAAVDHARMNGARTIEGFPVDPAARASTSAAELYHGTVSLFQGAGFELVTRPTPSRAVMRMDLSS